jgi:hypothetical protein
VTAKLSSRNHHINRKEPAPVVYPDDRLAAARVRPQLTTLDIQTILKDATSEQAARNWLTAAHAKGEIDEAQLRLFWPGDE